MTTVDDALQTQIRNIEASSGKSMAEWTELIRASGRTKHGEIIAMLKSEYGMTHGNANRVALEARDAMAQEAAGAGAGTGGDSTDPIAEWFAGSKPTVRPIYDRLETVVRGFGGDVEEAPKRGYVSLRRRKQFAMLYPAASRVDVGLILPGEASTERLEPGKTFNAMCTPPGPRRASRRGGRRARRMAPRGVRPGRVTLPGIGHGPDERRAGDRFRLGRDEKPRRGGPDETGRDAEQHRQLERLLDERAGDQ